MIMYPCASRVQPWFRLLVVALLYLPTSAYPQDVKVVPPLDLAFYDDGSYVFGPEYEGEIVRIIVVGGGGGGSLAALNTKTGKVGNGEISTGRVGAGGGSGAISYLEYYVGGDRTVTWKIGAGGRGQPWYGYQQAEDGKATIATPSFGNPVVAEGGIAGLYVSSGLTRENTGQDFPAPSMGGAGGLPRGEPGQDGSLNIRFNSSSLVFGGRGGRTSAGAGDGGNGASIEYDARLSGANGIEMAGFAGTSGLGGMVRLQVGQPMPAYLKEDTLFSIEIKSKESAIMIADMHEDTYGLDTFATGLIAACTGASSPCPKVGIENLQLSLSDKLTFSQKAMLIFATDTSFPAIIRALGSKAGFYTSLAGILIDALTPSVANAPELDHPIAANLKDWTGDEVQVSAAAADAVAKQIENTLGKSNADGVVVFPNTPETVAVAQSLRSWATSLRRELVNRRNHDIPMWERPTEFYGANTRSADSPPPTTTKPGKGSGPGKLIEIKRENNTPPKDDPMPRRDEPIYTDPVRNLPPVSPVLFPCVPGWDDCIYITYYPY